MRTFVPHTWQAILSLVAATAAAIALCVASGCTTDECTDNQNTLPLAGFYGSETPTKAFTMAALEVYGIDAPADSVLLKAGQSIKEVYLPFRISEPTTTYVFSYGTLTYPAPECNDTITFRYSAEPFFVSSPCGVSYRFHIEDIRHTMHAIDSVRCPGGVITNEARQNILIYFKSEEEKGGGEL